MTTTISSRRYAALALAHRWFAFLETDWGNLKEHLEMFDPSVMLTGRAGTVLFARDRRELQDWFASIPDPTSSHHLLHSVWSDGGPTAGALSFVVAYQSPQGNAPAAGAIIRYTTSVSFEGTTARFTALDKTPVLPDTEPTYEPSWAAHRAQAFLYSVLAAPQTNPAAAEALGAPKHAVVRAWASSTTPSTTYTVTLSTHEPSAEPSLSRWQFDDSNQSVLPTFVSTAALRSTS